MRMFSAKIQKIEINHYQVFSERIFSEKTKQKNRKTLSAIFYNLNITVPKINPRSP